MREVPPHVPQVPPKRESDGYHRDADDDGRRPTDDLRPGELDLSAVEDEGCRQVEQKYLDAHRPLAGKVVFQGTFAAPCLRSRYLGQSTSWAYEEREALGPMPFTLGQNYTRDEIHAELGGDKQSFLPWSGGRIVCGCFTTDLNPDVPDVVLVGGSDEAGNILKRARLLVAQGGTLPVFLKQASNQWSYEGAYRLTRHTEDPDELRQYREATRPDVLMALYFEPVSAVRRTYLLTWNPKEFPWDDIDTCAQDVLAGQQQLCHWPCRKTKRIRPGDRFFMLRQRVEPKCIMAAGWIISESFEKPHWDVKRAEQGVTTTHVSVRFERILVPMLDDLLPVSDLKAGGLAAVNWRTQQSGIEIKTGVDELERLWRRHLDAYDSDNGDGISAVEGGVTMALRRHRFRERKLRDAKLADYKSKNDGRLPCEECGLDFLAAYGEIGRDFVHVHHREPLGGREGSSVTRLQDLAVVCPNCHAMLHRGGDALPPGHLLKSRQGDDSASTST